MLEELPHKQQELDKENASRIAAHRLRREEMIKFILDNKLMDAFNTKWREEVVRQLEKRRTEQIDYTRNTYYFTSKAIKAINEEARRNIDETNAKKYVEFDEVKRVFVYNENLSKKFNLFVEDFWNNSWVLPKCAINQLLTTKEQIEEKLRFLNCVQEDAIPWDIKDFAQYQYIEVLIESLKESIC